jgi:hypothetical protein
MANMFLQQRTSSSSNGWQYCLQQWSWIELFAMGTMRSACEMMVEVGVMKTQDNTTFLSMIHKH